jgi:hypothetical protein
MPKGSIRGILALGLSGSAVAAVFTLGVEAAAPLLALAGVIVERYFGSRGDA